MICVQLHYSNETSRMIRSIFNNTFYCYRINGLTYRVKKLIVFKKINTIKKLTTTHKFYESGGPICNWNVVISPRNNIQLIMMLQLQHKSNNFQLTS